jgi:ubiquitin carboxyl-terminal hydrolase 25
MIANQFNEYTRLSYRLYAVFMHQGSVEFGHYYIYIYDFAKEVWRKYNDNDITEVQDTSEIFGNPNRVNPPTPYFLVYVNAAMKDRLVEPVCREIASETATTTVENAADIAVEPSSDEAMDVDMKPPAYTDVWSKSEPEGTQMILSPGSSSLFAKASEAVDEKKWPVVQADEVFYD